MPDYISNITTLQGNQVIGGKNFDGQFLPVSYTVCDNITVGATSEVVYDISSIVPNDGYDYELYVMLTIKCPATSGQYSNIYLYSGDSSSDFDYYVGAVCNPYTRHAVSQESAQSAFLPVKASRKKLVLRNSAGYNALYVSLFIRGLKRIGKNDTDATDVDYISNISVKNETVAIGGDTFDSQWTKVYFQLAYKTSVTAGSSVTYDVSSCIPDDGNDYEILVAGWGDTGTTKNNTVRLKAVINGTDYYLAGARATSSAKTVFGASCTALLSKDTRVISIVNSGTSTTICAAHIAGYRKLGKNNDNNEYLSSIYVNNNPIQIGGRNFDGQWMYKLAEIYNTSSLVTGTTYTIDISSYLPQDNNAYELIVYAWSYTAATSGRSTEIQLSTDCCKNVYMGRTITRASALVSCCGSCKIPISGNSRVIEIINNVGTNSGKSVVYLCGYRRLGTNK